MIKELLSKGKTKIVKGFKSQRTGKEFSAALRLGDNNKVVFDFDNPTPSSQKQQSTPAPSKKVKRSQSALPESSFPVGMTCPKCSQGTLIKGRSAWGCNRYREGCRFTFAFVQSGHTLTQQEATKQIKAL